MIVWREGEPVDRLDITAFELLAQEQELSRFIYNGTYAAYLILDDIRKGDRIEYAYTVTGRNPVFEGKFMKDLYLQSESPVSHIPHAFNR